MNNRKEYLKNYRLNNKEKYRQYQAKYRENHLSAYEKVKEENKQLKDRIDKAIEYIESNPNVFYDEYLIDVETLLKNEGKYEFVGEIKFISKLLEILKGDNNEC